MPRSGATLPANSLPVLHFNLKTITRQRNNRMNAKCFFTARFQSRSSVNIQGHCIFGLLVKPEGMNGGAVRTSLQQDSHSLMGKDGFSALPPTKVYSRPNVARRGWFIGYEGATNLANEIFNWGTAQGRNIYHGEE